jgi:hypothetical protein
MFMIETCFLFLLFFGCFFLLLFCCCSFFLSLFGNIKGGTLFKQLTLTWSNHGCVLILPGTLIYWCSIPAGYHIGAYNNLVPTLFCNSVFYHQFCLKEVEGTLTIDWHQVYSLCWNERSFSMSVYRTAQWS